MLHSSLPEAKVTFVFPKTAFVVGDQDALTVLVKPAPGHQSPVTIRGRFGMPYMHHWVTEEESREFSSEGVSFASNISMPGVFRFRVWLDYADGHQAKTAVDFKAIPDSALDPEIVVE